MRPGAPRTAEIQAAPSQNEDWRPRGAVDQRVHEIDRRRVEPLQVLDRQERAAGCASRRSPIRPSPPFGPPNLLRRKPGKRSGGTGMPTIGASSGASFAASSLTSARSASSSASRLPAGTSDPPNRTRPHPSKGWNGVFCKSWEELHSTQECGLSANWPRNSSISRDLPMPGSPTIRTNCLRPRGLAQMSGRASRDLSRGRQKA